MTSDRDELRPAAGIVLAGGRGSRLGGVDKPALTVAGIALIERALAALDGVPTVVVGPDRSFGGRVTAVREEPPGSGPAAAVAAGLTAVGPLAAGDLVAVLAADLPAVSRATLGRLVAALTEEPDVDGALLIDADGNQQLLLGVWRYGALADAVAQRPDWAGAPLRGLLAPLSRTLVAAVGDEAADIDTDVDLRRWTAD